jgi:ribosomal protein L11 methyltransferase
MYRWRKFAEPRWLQGREEQLQTRAGGALTVIERPGRSRVRLEVCCRDHRTARCLLAEFGGQIERLPREWLARFSRGQKPRALKIGKRLVVLNVGGASAPRRSRHKGPSHFLVIPAAAAFGTGEHHTTAMCLRLLEAATCGWKDNWRMLDAGTGTGILALAGRCFGAQDVLAIDNDPRAIATAKENARANAIHGVRFLLGDAVRKTGKGKLDVITANLFSELLVSALPFWKTRLQKNGLMILSGVLREQESALLRALRANRFEIARVSRRGKWIALLCSGGLHRRTCTEFDARRTPLQQKPSCAGKPRWLLS